MIVPRYVPGDWVAVVSDGMVALVPAGTPSRTVDRLWASLREGGSLGEHLEVLIEGGLAAVPPFALVSLSDGRVHAIVRGAVQVLVDADDGEHELDGSVVTTWHEANVNRARSVHVRATDAPADGVALPVLSAVVRAASVEVDLAREADARHRGDGRPARERAAARRRAAEPEVPATPTVPPAPSTRPATPAASAVRPAPAEPVGPEPEPDPEPEHEPQPVPTPHLPAEPDPAPAEPTGTPSAAADMHDLPPAAQASLPEPRAGESGDHDGLTVQSSDVATLRRQLPEWAGDAVPGPFSVPAPQAPPPAKIHLSSGLVISLNRPVLLGRAPQVSRVQNSQIPRLVTVASPNQDISRTHAEVRQDGEHVLVTDLRSTNGVLLLREGTGPQRLHPGEPTVVEPGVVVDLGEGVTFVVEHGP